MAQIDVEAESHWLIAGDSGRGLYDFYAIIIRAGGKVKHDSQPERYVGNGYDIAKWSQAP